MPTPSLVNIPFTTKQSLLFSQIPESGAGDFEVSRTTVPANRSTRINSSGLIETIADNVPRLDYPLGGAVNGCPALLVEPAATNLALQSQDFSTTWALQNLATVNPNTAVSPTGAVNADTINLAAVADSRITQVITVANSTTYTISCFYKNIALTAGELFNMRFNNFGSAPNDFIATATIDLAAGTASYTVSGTPTTGYSGTATGRIENYGNGWYRVSLTFTVGSAGGNLGGFQPAQVGPATARSFYAWGAQLEVGTSTTSASSVSSYIPTTTVQVARGADVIRQTNIASLIGQSEGTVYFEVEVTNEARNRWFFTLDSASNSFIQAWISPSRTINVQIQNNASVVMTQLTSSVLTVGYHKVAFAYNTATNGCEMFIDGVQNPVASRTVTGAGLPAFNNFTFGSYLSTQNDTLKGHVRAGSLYPDRLSNLRLEFLTAPVTYTTYAQMANALSYILP